MVDAAKECIQIHAVERTKRDQIQAYETTEIARIKAAEATLREYFEQTFTERRHNFDVLFSRLDTALTDGNAEVVTKVLDAVVSIARTSPIADIGDLSKLRAALDDPDHVWEF